MSDMVGWERIADAISGGERRKQIQALDAAKSGFEYDQETQTYGYIKGSKEDITAQENLMLKQQLQEVQNNLVTDKQWSAVVDSVESNNFDTFNEQLNTQPQLQKIFKQDLGIQAIRQLNPWDNDKQLQSFTQAGMNPGVVDYLKKQRDAILSGTPADMSKEDYETAIKQVGNAYPIIEKADGKLEATSLDQFLAQTGLLKRATKTSERQQVLDAIAMGKQALSGVTDAAYKATLQGAQGTAEALQAKGSLATSEAKKGVQGNEIMMKAMATGSAEEVLKAFQITNPELYLKTTRGTDSKRDSLQQYMEALDLAGVPKEERPGYVEKWIQKTTEGVGAVSKEKDITQLGSAQKTANELFSPNASSIPPKEWATKAQDTENNLLYNLPPAQAEAVAKVKTKLESNHATATGIEGMLKGQVPKIDKDVIQGGIDWIRSKIGIENAQTLANVDFNTKSGMLLAGYIKEMSGTAASDAEVSRLLGDLLGGNLTDETYIKQSMKSFANELRTKNNIDAKPYLNTLPATIGRTTNLKPKYSGGSQVTLGLPTRELSPTTEARIKQQETNLKNINIPTIKSKPQQGGKPSADSFWKD